MKTVHEMILAAGGYQHLRTHPIAIENPPYMKLCIEWIGDWYKDSMLISVAHYRDFGESDWGCDPDCVFAVWGDGTTWMPVSFEMSGTVYQEAAFIEDGKLMVRKKWQKDIEQFSKQWSRNLKSQSFPEALAAQLKK
jgi:hypothetical protein